MAAKLVGILVVFVCSFWFLFACLFGIFVSLFCFWFLGFFPYFFYFFPHAILPLPASPSPPNPKANKRGTRNEEVLISEPGLPLGFIQISVAQTPPFHCGK